MRRSVIILGSGVALTASCAFAQAAEKTKRPNIIYIMCDDMGYGDLGCYGQRLISTPNITHYIDNIRLSSLIHALSRDSTCAQDYATAKNYHTSLHHDRFKLGSKANLQKTSLRAKLRDKKKKDCQPPQKLATLKIILN